MKSVFYYGVKRNRRVSSVKVGVGEIENSAIICVCCWFVDLSVRTRDQCWPMTFHPRVFGQVALFSARQPADHHIAPGEIISQIISGFVVLMGLRHTK